MLSKGKAKEAVQYVNEAIGQAEKEQDKRALVAVYNEAGGLCRDFPDMRRQRAIIRKLCRL